MRVEVNPLAGRGSDEVATPLGSAPSGHPQHAGSIVSGRWDSVWVRTVSFAGPADDDNGGFVGVDQLDRECVNEDSAGCQVEALLVREQVSDSPLILRICMIRFRLGLAVHSSGKAASK